MKRGSMVEEIRVNSLRMPVLLVCFFVSGVAGLIYEVLWEKYLALYVGSTGLAQIIVLATFMGGLALGSHFLGRFADHARNSIRFYAILEFGIGIYALLFDRIFFANRELFIWIVKMTGLSASGLVMAKVVASSASILLPAFLMGGTLPAMAKCLIHEPASVGPRIARLYFLNSLGAVFGCLLAGFFLIRVYGLQFAMVIGSLMNIAAGIAAFAVLGESDTDKRNRIYNIETVSSELEESGKWSAGVILTCAGLSGAVSMMYEVAWIRLLTLVLGASTYSFSLMLATFILGLSIGGLVLSLRKSLSGYAVVFGVTEILVGVSVLMTLPLYVKLPYIFNQIACSFSREAATFGLYEFCKFFLCAIVMLVPTILQGMTLPAATKVLTSEVRSLGRSVGVVFAVNTVGTLAGVILAGFVCLPVMGIKGTLEAAILLNGFIGITVLAVVKGAGFKRPAVIVSLIIMFAAWTWYGLHMGSWDRDVLSYGTYRSRQRLASYSELTDMVKDRKTLFYRDGVDATVAVQDITTPMRQRILVINGKVDATTSGDMPTQKMVAHLPMLCHKGAEDVLVVGVGSGATIGGVLAYDVKHIDVVEISRDVIEASRQFETINGRYWEDPRVNVVWEDAKTYLQVTERKYDVIISEPTNPWIVGVAGVFSKEYFEICRDHLRQGGLFVQWIQGYELEDSTFFMMLETFSGVFPCYTMWNPTHSDTVLVGASVPYGPDLQKMQELTARLPVLADLRIIGIESLLPILGMQMRDNAGRYSHVEWTGAVHSDFFPVLEYAAARGFFVGSQADGARWLDLRSQSPVNSSLWLQQYLKNRTPAISEFRNCYELAVADRGLNSAQALLWASLWQRIHSGDHEARIAVAEQIGANHDVILARIGRPSEGKKSYADQKLWCKFTFEDYAARRNCMNDAGAAGIAGEFQHVAESERGRKDSDILRWCGELMYDLGRYDDAVRYLEPSLTIIAGNDNAGRERDDVADVLVRALLAGKDAEKARRLHASIFKAAKPSLKAMLIGAQIDATITSQTEK